MALYLEKPLYNGDTIRYHRIVAYTVDPEKHLATARLGSFRNQEHRELPVPPVTYIDFTFAWSGNTETLSEEAYAYIKSLPEWSEAVDV